MLQTSTVCYYLIFFHMMSSVLHETIPYSFITMIFLLKDIEKQPFDILMI